MSLLKRSLAAGRAVAADVLNRLKQDVRGARTLAAWVGEGGSPVNRALAEQRARICMGCPANQPMRRQLEASIATAIREQEEIRSQIDLRLPREESLHHCKACGCYLKLKVWVPMRHILAHSSPSEFPSNCWIQRESTLSRTEEPAPAAAAVQAPRPALAKPMIIVQRQNAMGDAIMASSVCTALHQAGHRVGFHTAPGLREIFQGHPHLVTVDSPGDQPISLDGAWERLNNRSTVHRADEYWRVALEQLKRQGIELPGDTLPAPVLALTQDEISDGYIETIQADRPLIGIVPGSKRYANRSIDDDVWVNLAKQYQCLWLAQRPAPAGSSIHDPGMGSLRRLMRLIHACDVIVSADTGPAHMALALGRPLVIVEGPFLAAKMLPKDRRWIAVSAKDLPCIGCGDFTCVQPAKGQNACTVPAVKDLVSAIQHLL